MSDRSDKSRAPLRARGFRILGPVDPRARIAVLVLLLVLFGAIWWAFRGYGGEPEREDPSASRPTVPLGAQPAPLGVPALSSEVGETVRDDDEESMRRWPDAAAAYLLREVRYTPAVKAYQRDLALLDAEAAEGIVGGPDPWRFQYFLLRGRLESIRQVDYEVEYESEEVVEGEVWRARISVPGSERDLVVLTPFLSRSADPRGIDAETFPVEGEFVRGAGIFVKRYLALVDGEERPVLLFVATGLERDYEARPVESLEDVGFEEIRDEPTLAGTEEEHLLFEPYPPQMLRLVRYAEPRVGEVPGQTKSLDEPGAYEHVVNHAAEHRGEYFAGLGVLLHDPWLEEGLAVSANDAGVEAYMSGWIGTDGAHVLFFSAPASMWGDWKDGQRIRYGGFFYKAHAYHTQSRGPQRVPWLVLTDLGVVLLPERDIKGELTFAGLFVLGVGVLIWLIVREDRTKADYREMRRRRRAKQAPAE